MNTNDDTISIRGLSAWFHTEPRLHHLDVRLQVGGQELRCHSRRNKPIREPVLAMKGHEC